MTQLSRSLAQTGAPSLTSRVYQDLRNDIICGRIAPGEKIRIKALQQRFDASLSVIREALSRLCAEDLVQALDQRGFLASSLSVDDLKDLIWTRRQLEGIAVRQAIATGSAAWEADVAAAYSRLALMDEKAGDKRPLDSKWIEAHEAFHHTLIDGCGSPWLIRLCDQFAERTQRYRHLSVHLAPHRDGPAEHKEILQAVLARDAERAAAVLDRHFGMTLSLLLEAWPQPD